MRGPVVALSALVVVMFLLPLESCTICGVDRIFAREMNAEATVKVLNSAEERYHSTHGRYAVSLKELATGSPSAGAADLIPSDFAKWETLGYKYRLASFAWWIHNPCRTA